MTDETTPRAGYDADGTLLVGGRRRFLLGVYDPPAGDPGDGRSAYRELADLGLDVVRVRADEAALDAVAAAGLRAWVAVGALDPANPSALEDTVRRYRGHPALLYWETVDEPAWTWNSAEARVPPEPLIATYRRIRALDPEHLVYLNHAPTNLVSTLQAYAPSTDITACDIYPVIPPGIRLQYALFPDGMQGDLLNPTISQVGEYTEKMRQVAGPGRPLVMVLQGFAWEALRDPGAQDPRMVLYPTYAQSRFMAYDAIIHGATGLLYWGLHRTPRDTPFWADLRRLWGELAGLRDALDAPPAHPAIDVTHEEMGHSVDRGVRAMAREAGGVTYLLTANADKNPARVRIDGLAPATRATVVGEGRTLPVHAGALRDEYAPFDVHVYALDAALIIGLTSTTIP
jgi:hypothetical protein